MTRISPGYKRRTPRRSRRRTVTDSPLPPATAFRGHRRLAAGPLAAVALAVRDALAAGGDEPVLVFDDASGKVIDFDLRGDDTAILARLTPQPTAGRPDEASGADDGGEARGRGRPRLGVVSREVSLLPRHWDWLGGQPGGASSALRRLVDEAARRPDPRRARKAAQERAYRFLQAIAGDFPHYEEATRALFADDRAGFSARIADWPADVRDHALRLAFGADEAVSN
nr:DUF2239 family protein [Oharaeibacter diazotrophicus]